MPFVEIGNDDDSDSVDIYVEDYGRGQPVILIHGWPLSHRMWEHQIEALVDGGYRCIVYDRRGFGESAKPWDGYDYDTLASDLRAIIDGLELDDVVLAGFSMGGGEVARYFGNYGSEGIDKAMLIAAVTPFLMLTDDNPEGVDGANFEAMIEDIRKDRIAFLDGFGKKFVNWGMMSHLVSEHQLNYAKTIASFASPRATTECVKSFGMTDFRDDLSEMSVPTLVIHGDADEICPLALCGERAAAMLPNGKLEVIAGGPHGLTFTHPKELNRLMLDFLSS